MGRKWVIVLTCVIYIVAGVWSLPVDDGQPVSSGIPANISSPEIPPETKAGVSKPSSIATPAQEAKDGASTADFTVKTVAGAENKTLESEANMTDASNVTEDKVDQNESDASKDPQSIATVVQESKGNESEKAVSDSNNPKSETPESSDPETLKPESRKAAIDSPTDVSQKPEDKEVRTNQSSLLDVSTKAPPVSPVPGVQKGSTAAAVAEKPGGSDVVVSEENKNTEVKKDSPVASAQDREVSQVPKVESPIDSPSKDESTTKPSSSFQPSVKLDVSKPPNENLPKGSSDDTISFGSEVNGDGSSIADGATYGDSYVTEDEEYEEESKARVESQRDEPFINNGGKFTDDADSHFFAYFLTIMVTAIIFYLVFHNKQRIIALIIEGRAPRNGRTRRASSRAKYHKLDNNLEEAITATKGTNGC